MRRGNFFDAAASAVELSWSLGQKRELDERRLLSLFSVTAFNNAFTAIVRVMTLQTSYYHKFEISRQSTDKYSLAVLRSIISYSS